MRWASLIFVALVVSTLFTPLFAQDYSQTCKYGLGYGSAVICSSRETEAMRHVAAAKTICISGNSQIQWRKTGKEPTWAWTGIQAGNANAIKDFRLAACEHADLVVKYIYDDMIGNVKFDVTDAESGDIVFEESRNVSDLSSDTVRMANHWREMVADAREAIRAALTEAEAALREQEQQAKREEAARKCQAEFDSLKQNILSYLEVQHVTVLPLTIRDQIAAHNEHCTNSISPEAVVQQQKADADARVVQEQAEKDKALQEKRAALLEKAKSNALIALTNQLASSPFVPPADGWTRAVGLGSAFYYIILPGTGFAPNCHFALDDQRTALDCLGGAGRNDYFSVQNNDRWYLLKSKWRASGEYAGTVKDGGSSLCLRKSGCYRVLAEVRPVPTELPDKFKVPAPGRLTLTYSNDDASFSYPQNWQMDEPKTKDTVLGREVGVAPREARLATWITHGMFIGHVLQFSKYPQTIDGAFDQFSAVGKQLMGMVVANPKTLTSFGNYQSKIATYTAPSILTAGESGWLIVVKDKGDGYYWMMMFYPSNDDAELYGQTFSDILKSFKFRK